VGEQSFLVYHVSLVLGTGPDENVVVQVWIAVAIDAVGVTDYSGKMGQSSDVGTLAAIAYDESVPLEVRKGGRDRPSVGYHDTWCLDRINGHENRNWPRSRKYKVVAPHARAGRTALETAKILEVVGIARAAQPPPGRPDPNSLEFTAKIAGEVGHIQLVMRKDVEHGSPSGEPTVA
jgi:hypothetical protein